MHRWLLPPVALVLLVLLRPAVAGETYRTNAGPEGFTLSDPADDTCSGSSGWDQFLGRGNSRPRWLDWMSAQPSRTCSPATGSRVQWTSWRGAPREEVTGNAPGARWHPRWIPGTPEALGVT